MATTGPVFQVNQFNLALGRLDQRARGLFTTLEQLSRQYQQRGFLGAADQRVLQRGLAQWDRVSQMLNQQRVGAEAAYNLARNQPLTPQVEAERLRQFDRLERFTRQQQALRTVAGTLQPLQAYAQQLQAAPPPGAVPVPLPVPGANLRGYAGAAAIGLLQQGGAFGRIAGGVAAGAAFGAAGGLPGVGIGAIIGGTTAILSEAFNKNTEAMRAWEQRSRGVLAVGQLLDQNFGAITTQVGALSKEFDVLTQDSLAAMESMTRLTGRRDEARFRRAVGFGVAYGMDPRQAAGLAGTLQMLGAPAEHPLAAVAAGARNAFGTGALPQRMDVLQEEAARVAGIGGTAAPPMDPEFYGRVVGFVGGMGQRYRMPGAAAGFAERMAQGISQAPDAAVQMLRHRAIEDLYQRLKAQGRSTTITIGQGPEAEQADLGSYEGRRIAMELAAESPQVSEAYRRTIREQFGFDPELEAMAFERGIGGGRLGPTESRRLRRRLQAGGGYEQVFAAPGRATAGTEAATEAAREQARKGALENLPARLEAGWQRSMEALGGVSAPWLMTKQIQAIEATEKGAKAAGDLTAAINDKFGAVAQAIGDKFSTVGQTIERRFPELVTALESLPQRLMQLWSGPNATYQPGLIPGLLGPGQIAATPGLPGGIETAYGSYQLLPPGWTPPTSPQRPAR